MNPSPQKGGFVKLHRKFFAHPLWMEKRALSRAEAFLDLLQLAAFTQVKVVVKGHIIELEPGQLCCADRYLAERWQWSTTKVRNFVLMLILDRMVDAKKTHGMRVMTLTNYVAYANGDLEKNTEKNHGKTTEKPPENRKEEGKEREEGESVSLAETSPDLPPSPSPAPPATAPEIPTLAAVQGYYRSLPEPAPPHVAAAFHDTQQAHGWATRHGQPIVDWRAAARRYLSRWQDIERAKPAHSAASFAARSAPRHRHHNGYHEDLSLP